MTDAVLPEVEDVATEAVRRLDVAEFIRNNLVALYEKLEEADRLASGSPVNDDVMFVALALPTVHGVIQFASNRKDLLDTMTWVKAHWKDLNHDPDPMSILSALTLIYIVKEGVHRFKDDPQHGETWMRISTRLGALKEEAEKVRPAEPSL